jgi:hypothetical protein
MFKKIREALDYWDLKSFFVTVIIFGALLIIGFFFFFSDIRDRFRTADKETFKGRTIATIISIKPIEIIKQGKYKGARIEVDSYEVSYSYNVHGQTFVDSDLIPLNAKNKKLLKELMDNRANDSIMVAFDVSTPRNSLLIIESQ